MSSLGQKNTWEYFKVYAPATQKEDGRILSNNNYILKDFLRIKNPMDSG